MSKLNPTTGPVFIFASGQRCGSTLLQRYLCSNPNMIIWGEHDGVLNHIFDQFDRLLEWNDMFNHQFDTFIKEGYNNFIPNMNPPVASIMTAQTEFVRNMWQSPAKELGRQIWGFKEVLYEVDIALRLKTLFPNAKFIHMTRNVIDCFISLRHEETISPEMQPHVPVKQVWTRKRTLEFIETWIRVNRSFMDAPNLDPDAFYTLTYDDLVRDPPLHTASLLSWLGLDYDDFDIEVFNHKLYTDRHKGPDLRPKVKRSDVPPDEIALVTTDEILEISRYFTLDMTITS